MEPIIETTNLTKSFSMGNSQIDVLKGINLTVDSGEFISMMGPSGSGKSTLLYLLGGLDKPTAGSVKINGQDIFKMEDIEESTLRRKSLGFIFQFYNLIPTMSVEENVLLPILLDGKDLNEYRKKVLEVLKLVGLANRRQHMPKELSGGQQQRVAIARSLINDPAIILADEPTGNLDSRSSKEILRLLKSINSEKGKTIIMVTHSSEAAKYGNRIINLADGLID